MRPTTCVSDFGVSASGGSRSSPPLRPSRAHRGGRRTPGVAGFVGGIPLHPFAIRVESAPIKVAARVCLGVRDDHASRRSSLKTNVRHATARTSAIGELPLGEVDAPCFEVVVFVNRPTKIVIRPQSAQPPGASLPSLQQDLEIRCSAQR